MLARVLSEAGMLLRLARDFRSFVASPVTGAQAAETVKRELQTRNERFLQMLEGSVFAHPRSPYRWLLRAAGCEFGDVRALVKAEGLEGALQRLCEAGVYVTLDEFKGRTALIRGSQRLGVTERDFDPPAAAGHLETRTGGSRGAGTALKVDLAFITERAAQTVLGFDAHGLQHHDRALWLVAGLRHVLQYAKSGKVPVAWFYPVAPLSLRSRVLAKYLSALGRLSGVAMPLPTFLDLREPARMARWLADHARGGRRVCLTTYGSSVVRVCTAARELGLDLQGVAFIAIGEPYTEARRNAVTGAGATAVPSYAFNEAGAVGFGCREPRVSDDIHVLSNTYGLVQHRRPIGDSGLTVDAFLFTSLLRTGPKVLLNAENGDHGTVTRRGCECLYGALGLDMHLGHIRSFEKLTTEGMTFATTDLLRILEEILPARFGGASTDYQLVEEPREGGLSRLTLMVSPLVGVVDEDMLCRTFLDELGRGGRAGKLMAGAWERAEAVTVRRAQPLSTKAGKIIPFHLVGHAVEKS